MDVVALGGDVDTAAGRAITWDEVREEVAAKYCEAGLGEMAAFVRRA
jgi:hypothetical protein